MTVVPSPKCNHPFFGPFSPFSKIPSISIHKLFYLSGYFGNNQTNAGYQHNLLLWWRLLLQGRLLCQGHQSSHVRKKEKSTQPDSSSKFIKISENLRAASHAKQQQQKKTTTKNKNKNLARYSALR